MSLITGSAPVPVKTMAGENDFSSIAVRWCVFTFMCVHTHTHTIYLLYDLYIYTFVDLFSPSDYGFARPSLDFSAPCMRDYSISLPNPCADGKTETYMASTG